MNVLKWVSISLTKIRVVLGFVGALYCSTGSTQSYLKYDIPLPPEDKLHDQELECLQTAIYFESRGLSDRSMALVGQATLNRASSSSGASTVCGTVHKKRSKTSCDYSWYCDGKSDVMKDLTQKERSYRVAKEVLAGKHSALTKATHFLHCSVVTANSGWLKNMKYLGRDKYADGKPAHCFYRNKIKSR
jgi:spore germination cell wall hydrolase CwlJ-like protein